MRDMSVLLPEFRIKIEELDKECLSSGLKFVNYFTLRTPCVQGKLWRQDKSKAVIGAEVARLVAADCAFLANCIMDAGPQTGPWATNAIPGLSWHQWGLAVDSYVEVNGIPDWKHPTAYKTRADIAVSLGLTAGYYFSAKKQDPGHIQMYPQEVLSLYTLKEVDDNMKERFGISS